MPILFLFGISDGLPLMMKKGAHTTLLKLNYAPHNRDPADLQVSTDTPRWEIFESIDLSLDPLQRRWNNI